MPLAAWQSTFIAHLQLKETSTCNFPLSVSKTTFEMGAQWADGRMGGKQMKSVPNKQQHPIKRAARRQCCFSHLLCGPQPQNMPACAHDSLLTSSHMSWAPVSNAIRLGCKMCNVKWERANELSSYSSHWVIYRSQWIICQQSDCDSQFRLHYLFSSLSACPCHSSLDTALPAADSSYT